MPDLIATIFHLTDMHLLVDRDGEIRKEKLRRTRMLVWTARRAPIDSLQTFFAGAMWHRQTALTALRRALSEVLAQEQQELAATPDAPIAVVQGGDVEALGSSAPHHAIDYEAFPSFEFVHRHLRSTDVRFTWLDIFGNHDTWPGTFPLLAIRPNAAIRGRIGSVPGLEGPWPDLLVLGATGPVPLVIARVNTVSRDFSGENLASGAVSEHPEDGASLNDVLDRLTGVFAPWQDRPVVRAALLHHPVHFAYGAGGRFSSDRLDGAEELAERLKKLNVQLVLAGHVHELDPPRDATDLEAGTQPPLKSPTVQLVAETPTQDWVERDDSDFAALPSRSFCRYRLWADSQTFDVERTVFKYDEGNVRFAPVQPSTTVFRGIPLE